MINKIIDWIWLPVLVGGFMVFGLYAPMYWIFGFVVIGMFIILGFLGKDVSQDLRHSLREWWKRRK